MTDLLGPWDALLLLVVAAVFAVALYWRWKRYQKPERLLSEQLRDVWKLKNKDAGLHW